MAVREEPAVITGVVLERGLVSGWARTVAKFCRKRPLGAFGGFIVLLLIFLAIFGGAIAPYSFDDFNIPERLHGPSWSHIFGTDQQGRDVFSRVLYGARTSVLIGFGAVAVSAVVATTIGVISGYFGGVVDILFQRIVEIWQSFPGLMFIIFLISIVGSSIPMLIITLGLLFSAGSSRVVRSATLSVKQNTYVEAAKVVGASDLRVIFNYILPNVFPVIIIGASIQIGFAILIESSLSFLGYGVQPPHPSWGRMLQEAQSQMQYHPYLAFFPGLAIALAVYSLNMLGDALRDALDPRLRGST